MASARVGRSARPRVTLVAHDVHDGGGMERTFAELIRRGHEEVDFTVVSGTLANDLRPLAAWRRLRIPRRPFPLKFLTFYVAAGLALARQREGLVHAMGAIVPNRIDLASVHLCHAAFRAVRRRLPSSPISRLGRLNTSISSALSVGAERCSYRRARVRTLATVSSGLLQELARHYPGVPTALTPNGVDFGRFTPDATARRQVRAEEGARADDVVALFVGGNWGLKGLRIAVDALALLPNDTPQVVLWVVGRGDEARMGEAARAAGLEGRVRFLGTRSDVHRLYTAADLLVLPSSYESFSLVALEAAASGIPLVATDAGVMGEIIGNGDGGVLVRPDSGDVAAALRDLAGDPALRARLGATARRRVSSYTWDRSVETVLDLYRRLSTDGSTAP